jgi:hypothetical protein
MLMVAPWLDVAVVGVAGLLAVAASVTMSVIAMRRDDVHALWLGMGFSVMAALLVIPALATLLVIPALATPGIILPANGLVQIAGALNLPIGGAILAGSGCRCSATRAGSRSCWVFSWPLSASWRLSERSSSCPRR